MKWPVKWSSKTKYVDIDTGEEITQHQFKKYYFKVKIDKHAEFTNANRTKGHIEYTIRARNKFQGELPFT